MTTTDLSSLDDLFREAKAQLRAKAAAKAKAALEAPPEDPRALWNNPSNWRRTRGIALIHSETETLLGQFSEYVHTSVPECRRLLRESSPILVEAAERVSGDWWIAPESRPEPRQEWHTQRTAILDIHLDSLGVHSPMVEVTAFLSHGGIARVELAQDTQFAQDSRGAPKLLFLPAGTDILPVMALDSKIALRVELGKEA